MQSRAIFSVRPSDLTDTAISILIVAVARQFDKLTVLSQAEGCEGPYIYPELKLFFLSDDRHNRLLTHPSCILFWFNKLQKITPRLSQLMIF